MSLSANRPPPRRDMRQKPYNLATGTESDFPGAATAKKGRPVRSRPVRSRPLSDRLGFPPRGCARGRLALGGLRLIPSARRRLDARGLLGRLLGGESIDRLARHREALGVEMGRDLVALLGGVRVARLGGKA